MSYFHFHFQPNDDFSHHKVQYNVSTLNTALKELQRSQHKNRLIVKAFKCGDHGPSTGLVPFPELAGKFPPKPTKSKENKPTAQELPFAADIDKKYGR